MQARVEELLSILADENKIKEIVREELLEIKRKFSDPRRTKIMESADDIELEDLIERHTCVITLPTRAISSAFRPIPIPSSTAEAKA